MTWIELVLIGLITWRLAVLFVLDDGPWNIIRTVREWSEPKTMWDGSKPKGSEESYYSGIPIVGGALQCVGCLSLWMAPLALLVVRGTPEEVGLVLGAWALATGTQRALS